jgi:hypothetical protein
VDKVDQFESVFRSAAKDPFAYERVSIQRVLIVTDLEQPQGFAQSIKSYLAVLGDEPTYEVLARSDFDGVPALLECVERARPDLIVAYRNLRSEAWRWPYSLGSNVDVLTQVVPTPVLLVPHPEAGRASHHSMEDTDQVMALADHLEGDASLVNWSVRFTKSGGQLWLAHIEDELAFDRFMEAVARVPEVDTELVREVVHAQLLKQPHDYIRSCREVLAGSGVKLNVHEIVRGGRRLAECKRLVEEHNLDLLVMHTKDQDQLAMHGLAYPLAVEVREIPLLLL